MAGDELTADEVAAVKDLIVRSELSSIEFHEVAARLVPNPQPNGEEEANIAIQMQHRRADDDFGIRMVGAVTSPSREVRVTVAAEYRMTDGKTPAERIVLAFANEVAVMSLFPYFREGVSSVSAKVFKEPILLPTIERGMIKFDLGDNE